MKFTYTLRYTQTINGMGWSYIIWAGEKGNRKPVYLPLFVTTTESKARYRARKMLKEYQSGDLSLPANAWLNR